MKFVFPTAAVSALLLLAPFVMPSRLLERSSYLPSRGHNHNDHQHHHSRSLHKNSDDYNYNGSGTNSKSNIGQMSNKQATTREGKPSTIQVAGSGLPDCSNACGSCKPCKLVMVTFICASLSEAESCPMAYKCMCRNKSYPVP